MKETSLKNFNSFRIEAKAKDLHHIYSEHDVYYLLTLGRAPYLVLGGGSNILFTKDVEGTLLKNEIKGINIIDEDENNVLVEVGAGENWHNFVLWSLSHGLYGLENLSLIPGCVGAAPIQNIGAYGVEQMSVFHSLKTIHFDDGQTYVYYKDDCNFGYRDSIFKHDLKNRLIITRVRYLLPKSGDLNISYGAIKAELPSKENLTPKDVSNVVISIRESKLPDPKLIPNAGSFFKNPVIEEEKYQVLKGKFSDLVAYVVTESSYKIAAGWMIENCGFKNIEINGVKSHENQALVITRVSDKSSGKDVWSYAQEVIKAVSDKFDIVLEPEVNIW